MFRRKNPIAAIFNYLLTHPLELVMFLSSLQLLQSVRASVHNTASFASFGKANDYTEYTASCLPYQNFMQCVNREMKEEGVHASLKLKVLQDGLELLEERQHFALKEVKLEIARLLKLNGPFQLSTEIVNDYISKRKYIELLDLFPKHKNPETRDLYNTRIKQVTEHLHLVVKESEVSSMFAHAIILTEFYIVADDPKRAQLTFDFALNSLAENKAMHIVSKYSELIKTLQATININLKRHGIVLARTGQAEGDNRVSLEGIKNNPNTYFSENAPRNSQETDARISMSI